MWFLNSAFLGGLITGLATVITGLVAIFVYKSQKRSELVNAAVSLLFEIRNSESKVDIINEKLNSFSTDDMPSVLPTNSWRNYSHLFAKHFDEDELQLMNSFYNSCDIIENLVTRQNNFIWIAAEERAKTVQRELAKLHLDFQNEVMKDNKDVGLETYNRKKDAITKYYTDELYSYAPRKTIDGLKFQIINLQKVTTTTWGGKIKETNQSLELSLPELILD